MGLNRFANKQRAIRRLAALPHLMLDAAHDALLIGGAELVAAMKRLVEVGPPPIHVRDTIKMQDRSGPAGIKVLVTAGDEDAFYARMLEFGTPRTRASPFFFPTYRAYKKRIKNRVTRATRAAAKRVAGISK